MSDEWWRAIKPGAKVRVNAPQCGIHDHKWHGMSGTFMQYTNPHGYALVSFDIEPPENRAAVIHPEYLEPMR
jgi:hypothetical protein